MNLQIAGTFIPKYLSIHGAQQYRACTKLIKGVILSKEFVHPGMPKRVENAKIALLNSALEVKKTEFDAKINIDNPLQMEAFLHE